MKNDIPTRLFAHKRPAARRPQPNRWPSLSYTAHLRNLVSSHIGRTWPGVVGQWADISERRECDRSKVCCKLWLPLGTKRQQQQQCFVCNRSRFNLLNSALFRLPADGDPEQATSLSIVTKVSCASVGRVDCLPASGGCEIVCPNEMNLGRAQKDRSGCYGNRYDESLPSPHSGSVSSLHLVSWPCAASLVLHPFRLLVWMRTAHSVVR